MKSGTIRDISNHGWSLQSQGNLQFWINVRTRGYNPMEIPSNIEVKMSYDSLPVVDEVRFYLSALVRLYIGFLTTGFQRTLILMKTGAGLGVSLHRIWSPWYNRNHIPEQLVKVKMRKPVPSPSAAKVKGTCGSAAQEAESFTPRPQLSTDLLQLEITA